MDSIILLVFQHDNVSIGTESVSSLVLLMKSQIVSSFELKSVCTSRQE